MGVLEFHVWGSHMETVEYPDQIVFDFDPDPELPFSRVVEGARLMHDLLEGLGLQSFVKTTGGKGLHVVAPVDADAGLGRGQGVHQGAGRVTACSRTRRATS